MLDLTIPSRFFLLGGGSTVAGTTFVIPVTIQETEAKTKQHRYLLARGSLWAGVKERTKRGGTEEEGGGGGEEWTPWRDWLHKAVLAPFMSRKQSSRCSLAAGVSLLQQRSCFNEPLMRTCILPSHLCCEVLGDVLPRSTLRALVAHSRAQTGMSFFIEHKWSVHWETETLVSFSNL